MMMVELNETINQLVIANSVLWYSNVLRKENGHDLRSALDIEVEGKTKKGRQMKTWKKQGEEECEGLFEHGRCTLTISVDCWH